MRVVQFQCLLFLPVLLSACLGVTFRAHEGITGGTYENEFDSALRYAECLNDGINAEGVYVMNPSCTRGGDTLTIRKLVEANTKPIPVYRSGPANIQAYLNGSASGPRVWHDVLPIWLDQIYAAEAYKPIWWEGTDWSDRARDVTANMRNVIVDGLLPGNYLFQERVLPSNPTSTQIAQIDVELTAGLLRYIRDVQVGRFGPEQSFFDPVPLFYDGLKTRNLSSWMAGLAPDDPFYQSLRQAASSNSHTAIRFATVEDFYAYAVTMERQRWDPVEFFEDSGRYVVMNIGAQETWAMNGRNVDIAMNVVVGRPSRQTPVKDDQITSVKFSPDWTSPYSIIQKDIVPRAQEDPEIFASLNLDILNGRGDLIDPYDLNWYDINIQQYIFRQPPGPNNLLGGVRFGLRNSMAIYMHDSPDRVFFNRPVRAYSSGCMRLEKSHELAYWLISHEDPSWTMKSVREAMESGETELIGLQTSVPLRTIYTTAWVSTNGNLRLTPDVYGFNDDLRERMGFKTQEQLDENPEQDDEFTIGDLF